MISSDPGSFRDPASRVVYDDSGVVRLLDERGLAAWRHLASTEFFTKSVDTGELIAAEEIDSPVGSAGALRHPKLPLVTYPYEWTFSMLKDAALLQLDLLRRALNSGLTIKDATPYNIQFVKGRPVFIDIGSFEEYRTGEPWIGYRQFTRQYLFPLMMRAWVGLPFQPWLRGDLEGPTADQMRSMLPMSRRLRPGALLHVGLQARLEARHSGAPVREDLRRAGFSADLILANVTRLEKLVASLDWEPDADGWSGYGLYSHVGRDREAKTEFLRRLVAKAQPSVVVDLGANDGHFSRVASAAAAHAVAVDGDEAVLDGLYRQIAGDEISIVLTDLSNPSPSQGWAGQERPSLRQRVSPDLVIAFGLIHHLIYTASIPPRDVVSWLRSWNARVALEFVADGDEMVSKLVANKRPEELHSGRSPEEFRPLLQEHFEIGAELALGSGTRILYELQPR